MAKIMKVGIIGMGSIGNVHADAYAANAGAAQLTAICDIDKTKLESQGEKRGIPKAMRFADYKALLKTDIKAVDVCVWNAWHKEIAIAALKAGKHVLLEKPVAMNAKEAAEIQAAAKKSGKTLQIGMVKRQQGDTMMAKKLVDEGVLGEIYHIRAVFIRNRGIPGLGGWFTTKSMSGGGPLIDCGVHWFDSALHVSGLWKPTAVSAKCYAKFGPRMGNYKYISMWAGPPNLKGKFDVEDYATGLVRFGTKATMSFEVTWAANVEENSYLEFLGDKGGLKIFDGKPMKVMTELNGELADVNYRFNDQGGAFANIFAAQADAFIKACRGEGKPAATIEEGLVAMKVMDAIYESDKINAEVKIK